MKSAQVSYAILAGLLLLIVLLITISPQKDPLNEKTQTIQKDPAVENFVSSCLKLTLANGLNKIALQGGYFEVEEPSIQFKEVTIPYYVYDRKTKIPSKDRIQQALSDYVESEIGSCLADFKEFKSQGYEISVGRASAQTKIQELDVQATLNLPLKFTKNDNSFALDSFSSSLDLHFAKVHAAVSDIIKSQDKDMNTIPLGDLTSLADQYDFQYTLFYLDENNVLYQLAFPIPEANLTYNFLANYKWSKNVKS